MMDVKPKSSGSKRLFSNPVLEKLSRTHIAVPITILMSFAAALFIWSVGHTSLSLWMTVGMFALGFVGFTWVEYNVHRYVFHMRTFNALRKKVQYVIHGVHHEFPRDKDRLAMPPLVSVTIATILLLIFRTLLGDMVFSFLPGFIVGYAYYLSIHYIVHAYQPPKNFLKILWINHGIHHYKNGDVVFGVSSPLWDYIYGTIRLREEHK